MLLKENKGKIIITSLITLLPILVGLALWDVLPDRMPTHWGVNGEVDGWQDKTFAVFFLPCFMVVMHWFSLGMTSLDNKNKEQSKAALNLVMWIIPAMSLVINVSVYAVALGYNINMTAYLSLFMGLMFIVFGIKMPKFEPNYTMGIRISSTLKDEDNWRKTHEFGGKIWVVSGILMMLTAILPATVNFIALMLIFLAAVIIPIVYSHKISKNKLG